MTTKPYYLEVKRYDGSYRPQIWWRTSMPIDKDDNGTHQTIRNVVRLDNSRTSVPLEQLYEEFNSGKHIPNKEN